MSLRKLLLMPKDLQDLQRSIQEISSVIGCMSLLQSILTGIVLFIKNVPSILKRVSISIQHANGRREKSVMSQQPECSS